MVACCRCTLSALLQPDVDNEAINAAHQWWDRERRPKPPKPKLSWACVQAVSVVSMEKQDEKHLLTSSSNSLKEPARLDGVALVVYVLLYSVSVKINK